MEVPDQDGIEPIAEARVGDIVAQPLRLERAILAGAPGEARGPVGERDAEVRVEELVARDAEGVAHHLFENSVTQIAPHQPVAMVDPDPPALELELQRPLMGLDPEFAGEERTEPEIVVAGEIRDADTRLSYAPERAQGLEVPARDGGTVLEPEVEQVAHDMERAGTARQGAEELMEPADAGRLAVLRLRAEVRVGEEVRRTLRHESQSNNLTESTTSKGRAHIRCAGPAFRPVPGAAEPARFSARIRAVSGSRRASRSRHEPFTHFTAL